jgi:hypothetical protein
MKTVRVTIVGIMINVISFVYAQERQTKAESDGKLTAVLTEQDQADSVSFQPSIRKMVLAMIKENKFIIPDSRCVNISAESKPGIYYLNVFPNPLNKTVQVSFKTVANINLIVHVVDKRGKVVYAQSYFDHCGDFFDLIQLNKELNGIYYLKLYTNEANIQRKLIMNF